MYVKMYQRKYNNLPLIYKVVYTDDTLTVQYPIFELNYDFIILCGKGPILFCQPKHM